MMFTKCGFWINIITYVGWLYVWYFFVCYISYGEWSGRSKWQVKCCNILSNVGSWSYLLEHGTFEHAVSSEEMSQFSRFINRERAMMIYSVVYFPSGMKTLLMLCILKSKKCGAHTVGRSTHTCMHWCTSIW